MLILIVKDGGKAAQRERSKNIYKMRNAREEQRATESEGITVLSRSTKYSLVSVLARVVSHSRL